MIGKAWWAFAERGDLSALIADYAALPPSIKDDPAAAIERVHYAMFARDFAAAKDIVSKVPGRQLFFFGASVPREIWMLWLELIQGNHPASEQFAVAREQLYQKVEANPTDPFLLVALAKADVALGRKEEAVQEARQAIEMRSISEDAVDGPGDMFCVRLCMGKSVGHCF